MSSSNPISPPPVPEEFVLRKADYFVDIQLWPPESKLNVNGWLSNFRSDERAHAMQLLNSFIYLSPMLTDELFKAAFQQLSRLVVKDSEPLLFNNAQWSRFRHAVVVTHVTGESPSTTDSGYSFARKARQVLDIAQNKIMEPATLVQHLFDNGPQPVLFVDDFVGSGNQFVETWQREVELRDGTFMSFERLAMASGYSFFYCPIVCTERGRTRIEEECKKVTLSPAHFLPEQYSAIANDSIVWTDELRPTACNFLEQASKRAGITSWQGFHGLGLAFSFDYGPPDATLPIFYHDDNGWTPLVKRT